MMQLAFAGVGYAPAALPATRSSPLKMQITDKAGMEVLAKKLNPVIGFYGATHLLDSSNSLAAFVLD